MPHTLLAGEMPAGGAAAEASSSEHWIFLDLKGLELLLLCCPIWGRGPAGVRLAKGKPKGREMIRDLKALGLAALAVFAIAAMVAPAAQAEPTLTVGKTSPFQHTAPLTTTSIHAKQYGSAANITTNAYTSPKLGNFNCEDAQTNFTVHPTGGPGNGTYSALTVTPDYKHCTTITQSDTKGTPVTVTMNGCDYRFFNFQTIALTKTYSGTIDLECPAGKVIEVHIYASGTVTSHSISICTLTVGPQNNLEGITLKNISEFGKNDDITVEVKIEKLNESYHGLCGAGTAENAFLHSELTLTSAEHDLWLSD